MPQSWQTKQPVALSTRSQIVAQGPTPPAVRMWVAAMAVLTVSPLALPLPQLLSLASASSSSNRPTCRRVISAATLSAPPSHGFTSGVHGRTEKRALGRRRSGAVWHGAASCRDQPSALVRIDRRLLLGSTVGSYRRLLLGSTVGSCWDRPSTFAGIDRKLQGELC
jgi:hypothetical protein